MVAFFNTLGGLMWVTESRVEEYKALGYQEYVEAPLVPTEEPAKEEKKEPATKPKTRTSATKKK